MLNWRECVHRQILNSEISPISWIRIYLRGSFRTPWKTASKDKCFIDPNLLLSCFFLVSNAPLDFYWNSFSRCCKRRMLSWLSSQCNGNWRSVLEVCQNVVPDIINIITDIFNRCILECIFSAVGSSNNICSEKRLLLRFQINVTLYVFFHCLVRSMNLFSQTSLKASAKT